MYAEVSGIHCIIGMKFMHSHVLATEMVYILKLSILCRMAGNFRAVLARFRDYHG